MCSCKDPVFNKIRLGLNESQSYCVSLPIEMDRRLPEYGVINATVPNFRNQASLIAYHVCTPTLLKGIGQVNEPKVAWIDAIG